jgi:hypothetical protein
MQLNTTYSFDSSHWPAGLQHCVEGLDQKIITSSHISSLQWHFQSPNKCLLFLLLAVITPCYFWLDLPDSIVKQISKANWQYSG